MESKIGYAYISLEEYRELIEEKEKLEHIVNELDEENKQFKINLLEKIYKDNSYDLRNYDGYEKYHHKELEINFKRYGFNNVKEIECFIETLVKRYKDENKEKTNE